MLKEFIKKSSILQLLFINIFCCNHYDSMGATSLNPLINAKDNIKQIAEALQSYSLDQGHFPGVIESPPYGLERLTTPYSYLSAMNYDFFLNDRWKSGNAYDSTVKQYRLQRTVYITALLVWILSLLLCIYLFLRYYYKSDIKTYWIIACLSIFILSTYAIVFMFLFNTNNSTSVFRIAFSNKPETVFEVSWHHSYELADAFLYQQTSDGWALVSSPGRMVCLKKLL